LAFIGLLSEEFLSFFSILQAGGSFSMAIIKNSNCARCKKLVSPLATYCEYCGCCFDTRIGLGRLVGKILAVICAFLLGSGLASYNLNARRAASEASFFAVPAPTPIASPFSPPVSAENQPTAIPTSEEEAADKAEETKAEEPSISREEFLRQESELKATQAALAELQRYIKELNNSQPTDIQVHQKTTPEENMPSVSGPKSKTESSAIIRVPNPTPTPTPAAATKPDSSSK
jgi:hypothetical protein